MVIGQKGRLAVKETVESRTASPRWRQGLRQRRRQVRRFLLFRRSHEATGSVGRLDGVAQGLRTAAPAPPAQCLLTGFPGLVLLQGPTPARLRSPGLPPRPTHGAAGGVWSLPPCVLQGQVGDAVLLAALCPSLASRLLPAPEGASEFWGTESSPLRQLPRVGGNCSHPVGRFLWSRHFPAPASLRRSACRVLPGPRDATPPRPAEGKVSLGSLPQFARWGLSGSSGIRHRRVAG